MSSEPRLARSPRVPTALIACMTRIPQRYRYSYTEEELTKLSVDDLREWINRCRKMEADADARGTGRAPKARHQAHLELLKALAELENRGST